jgi:hypothetical protein
MPMKRFLIRYTFSLDDDSVDEWHEHVAAFIAEIENDPELTGRLSYRCLKIRDGREYLHLAEPTDDEAIAVLQGREYFKRYTEESKRVGGGSIEVSPLETIAETK